jgi:hypothetical protein
LTVEGVVQFSPIGAALAVLVTSVQPAFAQIAPNVSNGASAIPITVDEVNRAQAALSSQLIDPVSAQYDLRVAHHIGKAAVFCGFVNAKNRFGGYTGFEPFVIFGGDATILQPEMDKSAFNGLVNLMCMPGDQAQ